MTATEPRRPKHRPLEWDDPDLERHNHVASVPEHRPSSWAHVDLADVVGQELPPPRYLARSDGRALFYAARDHTLFGASGSHKSWVALAATADALADPAERVAYLDFEDNAHGIVSRLVALGVPAAVVLDPGRFRYVRPNEPVGPNRAGQYPPGALDLADLVAWRPTLAVIDGVTESLAIEGLSGNDGGDVARWFLLISRRLTDVGACVVTVDHTAKNGDGTPSELGSQHKRAGLTGASFFVDAPRPLRRAVSAESQEGLVRLRLMKDRVGWLAGTHPGPNPVVADLDLTAWPDGGITWKVLAPDGDDGSGRFVGLVRDILVFLDLHGATPGHPGLSTGTLAQGIGRSRTDAAVGLKLTELVKSGHLSVERGPRNANLYALTVLGAERAAEVKKESQGEQDPE